MNVLFISSFSLKMNTSATIQNLIIIEGLKKLGYNVDVITSKLKKDHIAYDDTLSLDNVRNYYEIELPNSLETFQSKKKQNLFTKNLRIFARKIYNELEMYDAYKYLIGKINTINLGKQKYEFIISTSDPKSSHLLANKIIERYHLEDAKWIQYWGDPMYLDITRDKKFMDFRVRKNELSLLKKANRVVYATPFTLEKQKVLYFNYSYKMDYSVQGYWKDYIGLNKSNNEKFTVGYFGNYSEKIRNIDSLYNAINSMHDIELLIGGTGKDIETKANTKVLGFLKHQIIKKYEERCDILICLLNNKGTQIPGKIYYYSSFNKPILIILDGELKDEMRQFLESFNRFEFCENNETAIKTKLYELMNNKHNYDCILPEQLESSKIVKNILGV